MQFAPVRAAAYAKLHQRASHYAIVGVAAALEVNGGTIAVGAGRADRRLARAAADECRAGAGGAAGVEEADRAAAKLAGAGLENVNSDIHASEEYRRAMIPVFARRALGAALARR